MAMFLKEEWYNMYRYIDRYYPSWFYPAGATTTTTGGASCASGLEQNIADGYCDDKNNVEECQWDGGDCCLDTVLTDYCDDCACLDPGAGDSGTTTITTGPTNPTTTGSKHW